MRRSLRTAIIAGVAMITPLAMGALDAGGKFAALHTPRADTVSVKPLAKKHDPAKPTAVFLAGSKGANAGDLLGPYEVLAETGRFNTYVVAPSRKLVPLTGGLDIMPDLSFDELSNLLRAQGDRLETVFIPAMPQAAAPEARLITDWLRGQSRSGTVLVSVCAGARVLAGTGLLDGRTATSHWWRISEYQKAFPSVDWIRGRRYVDDGDIITTAGVLSGIEGAIRIVERTFGADAAKLAAENVGWRHLALGKSPSIPEAGWELRDAVVVLNAAFRPRPNTFGVLVTEGVGEHELASALMPYTEQSMLGRTLVVGEVKGIRSKHGLTFVPRSTVEDSSDKFDRLLVPGLAASQVDAASKYSDLDPVYLHTKKEFAFDPALRDIASTYDTNTARQTAKSLEYPLTGLTLSGGSWPWSATIAPFALALLGLGIALGILFTYRRLRASQLART